MPIMPNGGPYRVCAAPNGSRLSCGRPARRSKAVGRQSVPARAQHSASLKAISARQLQALVRQPVSVLAQHVEAHRRSCWASRARLGPDSEWGDVRRSWRSPRPIVRVRIPGRIDVRRSRPGLLAGRGNWRQESLPRERPSRGIVLSCEGLPNGSRLSCGRLARRRKAVGRSPCAASGTTLRFL